MPDNQTPAETLITDSQGRPISRQVSEILETLRSRVRPALIAAEVWEDLTEDERVSLGGDLQECWERLGTVGMWMNVRGDSLEQSIVSIAQTMDLVDKKNLRTLTRELALKGFSEPTAQATPNWDSGNGELKFGHRVIRQVRIMREPSNIQQVLDAFQAAGWPLRINNPLSLGQEQLHQTLRSLNTGLEAIQFRAQEGAQAVVWELR